MIKNAINFLKQDIWLLHPKDMPPVKAFFIQYLKIFLLSFEGFTRDLCFLRASALTLFSMLSIVPVFAMLFGIAKGFGFEQMLEEQIIEQIPQQESMVMQLIDFAKNMLANTKGGVVAGVGLAALFYTVMKVISNIEDSFNHIWKVKKGRHIGRKVSDYLSLMLLAPVLLLVASSLTVFVRSQISGIASDINLSESHTAILLHLLNYSSWGIIWLLFSFTFIFMPNTKVKIKSGITAGIIAGTLYQLVQWGYISLQIGVSSHNAIYGSFAALPLFVVWLQIAWLIVLMGCEISFYDQHIENYRHNQAFSDISFSRQKMLALKICHLIFTRFSREDRFSTFSDVVRESDLPVSIVQSTINQLLESQLIVAASEEDEDEDSDEEKQFLPAHDVNQMTIFTVMDALDNVGNCEALDSESLEPFLGITQSFNQLINTSDQNRVLINI